MQIVEYASRQFACSRERGIRTAGSLEVFFAGSFHTVGQLPGDHRPHIAVAGRSNVGKSSLLNRLLGIKRLAAVSSTPGKTRSLNLYLVNDDFYLVDLPGYGYAKVSKSARAEWRGLIEEYLTRETRLIGLVLLVDCRRDVAEADRRLVAWVSERQLPVLVALTKADKLNRDRVNRNASQVERELGAEVVPFSAVSGLGKNELLSAVRELVKTNHRRAKGTM